MFDGVVAQWDPAEVKTSHHLNHYNHREEKDEKEKGELKEKGKKENKKRPTGVHILRRFRYMSWEEDEDAVVQGVLGSDWSRNVDDLTEAKKIGVLVCKLL